MSAHVAPKGEANRITQVLNVVLGNDRFPVDVVAVAKDLSRERFPDDPVTLVKGASLGRFDGGLYRAPAGKRGWGIVFNKDAASTGRIQFTLAHEFGHYVLHRRDFPDGIRCTQLDVVTGSEARRVEWEANQFAATLLMPFDDFRRQIDASAKPALKDIGACADRYGTSLTAATLRWLEYTTRRAVLVVSRDGFILWSRSSRAALRTGRFFRTANVPPLPVPRDSLAHAGRLADGGVSMRHRAGTWFSEPCEEVALLSDRYDFAISLLHLDPISADHDTPDEPEEVDAYEGLMRRTLGCCS